jgi:exodeoxyribonuclease VII large subunit
VQELLPFSDEALLRAVANTRTPVVSAIGHEQHTPLLDLVADWRASTPTDAGKRVVPDVAEEQQRVLALRRNAWRCVAQRVEREQAFLDAARSRPVLAQPEREVERRAAEVTAYTDRARRVLANCLEQESRDVAAALARVTALSPKATLDRGYAVVQRQDGHVLLDADVVERDELLRVRLARGELAARVTGEP